MPNRLPDNPTAQAFAQMWAEKMFAPAVEQVAGRDGRVSATEAGRSEALTGGASHARDNLRNVFETQGSARPSTSSLVDAGYQYALAHAERAAGQDGRISLSEIDKLPEDLREDFQALLAGEASTTRLEPRGYRYSHRVLDSVVDAYNITDTQALLDKAIERGDSNQYLNRAELTEAAEALQAEAILLQKGVIDEAGARRVMNAAQVEGLNITDAEINALISSHTP